MVTVPHSSAVVLHRFITQVSAGCQHSLFLTNHGTCFRTNSNCLPFELDIQGVSSVAAGTQDALIADDGVLYLLKDGAKLTKIETTVSRILSVSLGRLIGCALDEKGFVWTWGNNTDGELGLGDRDQRDLPSVVL